MSLPPLARIAARGRCIRSFAVIAPDGDNVRFAPHNMRVVKVVYVLDTWNSACTL